MYVFRVFQNKSLRASSLGHGLECAVEFWHDHVIPLQVLLRRVEKREFEPTDQVCDREIDFHIRETGAQPLVTTPQLQSSIPVNRLWDRPRK